MRGNNGREAATAVVIDSNQLRQQRTKRLLYLQGIEVVGMSSVVERAAEFADIHGCDLLIVALGEEISAGTVFSVLRKAHRRCAELVSVALVENDDPGMVEAALAAGAFAAVDRSTSVEEVARLAERALSGGRRTRRTRGCSPGPGSRAARSRSSGSSPRGGRTARLRCISG